MSSSENSLMEKYKKELCYLMCENIPLPNIMTEAKLSSNPNAVKEFHSFSSFYKMKNVDIPVLCKNSLSGSENSLKENEFTKKQCGQLNGKFSIPTKMAETKLSSNSNPIRKCHSFSSSYKMKHVCVLHKDSIPIIKNSVIETECKKDPNNFENENISALYTNNMQSIEDAAMKKIYKKELNDFKGENITQSSTVLGTKLHFNPNTIRKSHSFSSFEKIKNNDYGKPELKKINEISCPPQIPITSSKCLKNFDRLKLDLLKQQKQANFIGTKCRSQTSSSSTDSDLPQSKYATKLNGQLKGTTKIFPKPCITIRFETTVFYNVQSVCQSMRRSPKSLAFYIFIELGITGYLDDKQHLILRAIVDQQQIEEVVRRFIKDYVMCRKCKTFRTVIYKGSQRNYIKCKNCRTMRKIKRCSKPLKKMSAKETLKSKMWSTLVFILMYALYFKLIYIPLQSFFRNGININADNWWQI